MSSSSIPENAIQLKTYVEQAFGKTYYGRFFTQQVYEEIKTTLLRELNSQISWKESVDNFAAIATTYTNPEEGWTVSTKDDNNIYRYDAETQQWVNILANAVVDTVTASKDGLMPKELFSLFDSNRKLSADSITENANRKFISEAKLTELSNKISFDGYGGTGGYYGSRNFAARVDHSHQSLADIETISFKQNNGTYGINFAGTTHNGKIEFMPLLDMFSFKVNEKSFTFGATTGLQIDGNKVLTTVSNLEIGNIRAIDRSWHSILAGTYELPSWNDIQNKPAAFPASAHTHVINEVTDVHADWKAILKTAYEKPTLSWETHISDKPETFNATAHKHFRVYQNLDTKVEQLKDVYHGGQAFIELIGDHILDVNAGNSRRDSIQRDAMTIVVRRNDFNGTNINWGFGVTNLEVAEESHTIQDGGRPYYKTYRDSGGGEEHHYLAMIDYAQKWTAYQDFVSGAGNTGSDMRYKKNISPVKNVLDKVKKLEIFNYDWIKENEERRTFGVNANQLIEFGDIFENIVHERTDEEKTKWVEYDRFGIIAIKALQEYIEIDKARHEKVIDKLSSVIDSMSQKIEELEEKLKHFE